LCSQHFYDKKHNTSNDVLKANLVNVPKVLYHSFSKSLYGFLNFEDGGEHGKCDKVIANQAHNTKFQNYKKIELEPTKTKAHMVV
jgi:hypothetical protein